MSMETKILFKKLKVGEKFHRGKSTDKNDIISWMLEEKTSLQNQK